jgi:hypothetical protein
MAFNYVTPWGKRLWFGYDETEEVGVDHAKTHCYYMTNKNYGSEFLDKPKTLGIVIYCPVTLDQEIGLYEFKKDMIPGNVCRKVADHSVELTITLRESNITVKQPFRKDSLDGKKTITADIVNAPAALRERRVDDLAELRVASIFNQGLGLSLFRPHAVCCVQV